MFLSSGSDAPDSCCSLEPSGSVGTGSVGTGSVGTGSVGTDSVGTDSVGTGSVGTGSATGSDEPGGAVVDGGGIITAMMPFRDHCAYGEDGGESPFELNVVTRAR